jgi:hypothetical protein
MGDLDELLTQGEYAKERKCSERTLERERATGTGCKFIKIGRAIRYRRREIRAYHEEHLRQSTSESARPVAALDTLAPETAAPRPESAQPASASDLTVYGRSQPSRRNRNPRLKRIVREPRHKEEGIR